MLVNHPWETKAQVIRRAKALGYVQTGIGECGDGGYGSRLYFEKPGCEKNEYGAPLEPGVASRLPRLGWQFTEFLKDKKEG